MSLQQPAKLIELIRMIKPQDMGRLMQLLDDTPKYNQRQFQQGQKYPKRPKMYTNPYPELR
jgi:hypothetical protein